MKRLLLLLATAFLLAACGDRITKTVILKAGSVADSLRHDKGHHYGQDSTKNGK